MQSNPSTLKTSASTLPNLTPQADVALPNAISGLWLIALPAVVICAIGGYRKHRAMTVRRQIKRLNQLWQLDSDKTLS